MNIDITLTIRLAPALEALIGAALGAPAPKDTFVEKDLPEKRSVAEVVTRPTQSGGASQATPPATSSTASTPENAGQDGTGQTAQIASPSKGRGKAKTETAVAPEADPFALKPAAEAAEPASSTEIVSTAEPASEATPQAVQAAMNDYMKTHSAKQLKELFETNFKAVDGAPPASFSKLQAKDYAAVLAKLAE